MAQAAGAAVPTTNVMLWLQLGLLYVGDCHLAKVLAAACQGLLQRLSTWHVAHLNQQHCVPAAEAADMSGHRALVHRQQSDAVLYTAATASVSADLPSAKCRSDTACVAGFLNLHVEHRVQHERELPMGIQTGTLPGLKPLHGFLAFQPPTCHNARTCLIFASVYSSVRGAAKGKMEAKSITYLHHNTMYGIKRLS